MSNTDNQGKNTEYEVGYGKPPKHTQFKPGQSGNPAGRPKKKTLSEVLRDLLGEDAPRNRKGQSNAEVLAEKIIALARKGNVKAFKEIADRTEGKPAQALRITGDPDNPIVHEHYYDDMPADELGRVYREKIAASGRPRYARPS